MANQSGHKVNPPNTAYFPASELQYELSVSPAHMVTPGKIINGTANKPTQKWEPPLDELRYLLTPQGNIPRLGQPGGKALCSNARAHLDTYHQM
jgi:hypothetical protein